ncbi:alpha-latrocrustotoxin-Lt1a-like isoform X1 [Phymastichus coffea]|uniref:alpha-latrocrustotoxin-Lt1a-like isoform X1 n=1 Tax=Phymastichus coffea TaxID=108790 RepID=UPI00273C1BC4|nr:alpha-latrocrustotoxin-Lt1a-like isoform X1 [Phymastichus coffea]
MIRSNHDDLFDALRKDDLNTFRNLLLMYGWPSNTEYSDYHLFAESIKFGRKNIANYLLNLKCRLTKPGSLSTFVHVALTYTDWRDIVMKLVSFGAPVSTVNAQGNTAVHVAFKNKADGKLIDLLLAAYVQENIVNIADSDGLSILHIACSRPNLKIVEALTYRNTHVIISRDDVNAQVQSNTSTYSRYTPLHFAIKNGRKEIIKFLMKHFNADINKTDATSSTPLHLALERSDIETLDCLLAHDRTHRDIVNDMGFSHFMAACAGSNTSIVAEYFRLLQYRPWTTAESFFNNRVMAFSDSPYGGYSAFHFAAEFGRLETVQLLLAHGASYFVLSAENVTPLVTALKRGHENVYRLLWRRYKAYRQSIYDAIDAEENGRVNIKTTSSTDINNQVLSRFSIFNSLDKNQTGVQNEHSPAPYGI